MTLSLTKTNDILLEMGRLKQPHQTLIGFSLETHDGEQYALEKLEKNQQTISFSIRSVRPIHVLKTIATK